MTAIIVIITLIVLVAIGINSGSKKPVRYPGKIPKWYFDRYKESPPLDNHLDDQLSSPDNAPSDISGDNRSNYISPRQKGRSFEEFVITRFNNKEYRLIEWRSDKFIHGWGGPVSCQWPDLVMEHINSGSRFAIECKFRSRAEGGSLKWARPEQLDNYRDYETRESVPVFVAIGLGGEAHSPTSLFIVRLERMNNSEISLKQLERFRFPANVSGLEFG